MVHFGKDRVWRICGGDARRGTLHFLRTRTGERFYADPDGGAWRTYPFVEGTVCYETAETPELFAASGRAFGRFQRLLQGYPAHTLYETIPRFHDTEDRLAKFKAAVAADKLGRVKDCQPEIDFVLAREKDCSVALNALREGKLNLRLNFLQDRGITFPEAETDALHRLPSAGKPHLGNLMVKYGYAASRVEAIRDGINLCPTGSSRISAETAVRAILASGGIPVWAHPLGGEGEKAVGPAQFTAMLDELSGYGILGLECFYSKCPLAVCERLAGIARDRGLLVSGGSDYHGTNKAIAPGTLNADGHVIPPERITLLGTLADRR